MVGLGFVYSGGVAPAKLNSSIGLAVAGVGAVLPYISCAVAATGGLPAQTLVSAVLLGVWVWLVGAAKDLSDVSGDAAEGRRTLPVRFGVKGAATRIARRAVLLAGVFCIAVYAGLATPVLLVASVGAVLVARACMAVRHGVVGRRAARAPYRAFMLSQYLMNCLIVLSGLLVAG